ncbi:MAG: hypothetical protein JW774_02680 [Candidatus Aureabacteria bacterium]|nr:hypothetical protein [Candidatus Auribacterota bacterium]
MKPERFFELIAAIILFVFAFPDFSWEKDVNTWVKETFIRISFKLRDPGDTARKASHYLVIECPKIPIPETNESFYDVAGVLKKLQVLNPAVIIFDTDPGVSKDSPLQYWLTSLTFKEKMVFVSPEKGRNIATLYKRKRDYSMTNAVFAFHQKKNLEVAYFKEWDHLPPVGDKVVEIISDRSQTPGGKEPVFIHYYFNDEDIPHQNSRELIQTRLPPCSYEGKIILIRTGSFSAFEKPFLTAVGIQKPETLLFNDIETRLNRPASKMIPGYAEWILLGLFLSLLAWLFLQCNVLKALIFSIFLYELNFFAWYFLFQKGWDFRYGDFIILPFLFILAAGVFRISRLTRNQDALKELEVLKKILIHRNKELAAKNRLSELGRLSASIYHEISNPLHNITNAMKSLKQGGKFSQESSEILDIALSELQRLQRLSKNLKQFYHPVSQEKKQIDVNELLTFGFQMMNTAFYAKKIEIVKDMKTGRCLVDANPDQLLQVFLNLLLNALDAVRESGKIWIESGEKEGRIVVKIRDSGPGIIDEIRADIFKAFFTTKGEKGSGLGLSVSYEIINSLGGDIVLSPFQAGYGAEFVIHLPKADQVGSDLNK